MLRPTVPPTVEPVTLTEARAQCAMDADITDKDTLLQLYITAARAQAEHLTGQRLMPQTWELYLPDWPADGCIALPQLPVRSITSVKYVNTSGVLTTVNPATYRLRSNHALPGSVLEPVYGGTWPTDLRADDGNVITVAYVCGLAATPQELTDVAPGIRDWILVRTATALRNAEAFVIGKSVAELPPHYIDSLLDPYRVYR